MRNTTGSSQVELDRHGRYEKLYGERLARMIKENVPNPNVHCGESVHIDEPEHFRSGGMNNPFFKSEKVVDKAPSGGVQ